MTNAARAGNRLRPVVRRRCSNCAHAIIPKRRERKGMPVLICGASNAAGWDAVREFDNCCDKWEHKASNAPHEPRRDSGVALDGVVVQEDCQ